MGWTMDNHLRAEFVIDALEKGNRKCCSEVVVRPYMGPIGDCFDNALC